MVGRGRCSQVLASFKIQFGGGTREARSTFAESLVALHLVVRTKFGEGGGQFDRRGDRGVLNSCARESKARTGRFLKEKLISDHGLFSSCEGRQKAENGKYFLAPASPAQGLHHGPRYFIFFSYLRMMCGLEKLGLVDQN